MAGPLVTTLTIDRIACDGYGMCAELLPERIDLDDWGYPIISPEPIAAHLVDRARRAVSVCPVLAIRLSSVPAAPTTDAPVRRPSSDPRETIVGRR